ncbi:MAG: DUF4340 domain-containing protein [Verrucomicrobiota bacterium]|nr:DUF4340 domain-containing protein [Verrucomicrobiota bacterium]MEE2813334.1 DUF4340 domain-containing protein [Verrucomicrobiota bacterium]
MLRKDTFWLIGAAIFAVGYLFIFEFDRPKPSKSIPDLVDPFDLSTVKGIQITYNGTNILRATHLTGRWMLEKPIHYPAIKEGPQTLLTTLSKLKPFSYKDIPLNVEDFGFRPPRVAIALEEANGKKIELHLGDFTPLEDKIYARSPKLNGVFTIDRKFLDVLPFTENFWRDRSLFHLDQSRLDIDQIHIRSGPRNMILQQTTNTTWQVSLPAPTKRGDSLRIKQMLLKLWNWNVVDFVTDDPKADLQRFGLQSPDAELVLSRGTNRLATIQFGHSPTNQPGLVYARCLTHTNVVIIPKPWLEELRAPVWDFCDNHLVDAFDPGVDSLARIEVKSGEPFTLQQSTNGLWSITQPVLMPADEKLVINLLQQLRSLKAIEMEREVVGDFSAFGLDKPSGQYTLRQRGGTNAVMAQISFGSPAGDTSERLFARRHDEGAVYVVSAVDRQNLPSYSYQLRASRFWQFSPNEVTKITLTRGEESMELIRNTKGQWASPKGLLPPEKYENISTALNALGRLEIAAWTAQGADKLATYDILQRKKTIILELQRNGEKFTRKVQFGKQAPSLNFYAYATDPLEQEPVVFEFPLNTYNACEIILFPLLASESKEQ